MQATLTYNLAGYSEDKFYNYIHNRRGFSGQLEREAIALMEEMGVPLDQPEYDALVHIPNLIEYFNHQYAGRHVFKAFLFGELDTS